MFDLKDLKTLRVAISSLIQSQRVTEEYMLRSGYEKTQQQEQESDSKMQYYRDLKDRLEKEIEIYDE